jgi:regulator of protease activity HflC (stomatin/prohibitin superfamily)
MSPLARYHREIMGMFYRRMSVDEIATHLYEHALGPVDIAFREKDIATIRQLVASYLANSHAMHDRYVKEKEADTLYQAQRAIAALKAKQRRERQAAEARRLWEEAERERQARRQRREEAAAKFTPWRGRDWNDVLPPTIATQQASWCRHMAARRMRQAGLTLDQIGYRLGVTRERVRQIVQKAQRYENNPHGNRSPLERYMHQQAIADSPDDEFQSDLSLAFARRFLATVEALTGRVTVPPCSAAERRVWELYYATRADA